MEKCQTFSIDKVKISKAKRDLPAPEVLAQAADVFTGFGDPNRIKIIAILSLGEFCVCEIVEIMKMSQSAVSHMLRVLRNLRLVKSRKEGKMVYYSLDDRHIVRLFKTCRDHVEEAK